MLLLCIVQIKKALRRFAMSDAFVLSAVVIGFFAVFTLFGMMIERFGWVEEEKDTFDKEF